MKHRQVAAAGGPSRALRRRMSLCSIEAVLLSLAIHLIVFLTAGSVVVLNVSIGRPAAFRSEKRNKPPQALPLPVRIPEFQKKGPALKIASRVVAASAAPLTLPSMKMPEAPLHFESPQPASRSLSAGSLPSAPDLGVSSVNFFGTKARGEKMVFILDASKRMMEDAKGGYLTYRFAKEKVHRLVDAMPAATLFNVMIFNELNVDLFRPQPVPATQENRDALKHWLEPVNSDPFQVGRVTPGYRPFRSYKSSIGSGARGWVKAVQAAMEQTADNIFVLCAAYGTQPVSGGRSGAPAARDERQMEAYREKLAAVNAKAQKAFDAENAARAAKRLPPKIVHDWNAYMTEELRLVLPDPPVAIGSGSSGGGQSPVERLVLEHLDAVWMTHYTPLELAAPRLHFVYLVAADASLAAGHQDVQSLRQTAEAFRGDFEFLRGARTMKNLLRYNP